MHEQRHALSEARDPRSDTFPLSEYFSTPAVRCARNAQAVRLSERGVAPRYNETLRRPARGQKGRDTHGFPSSLNSCLSFRGLGADGRLRKRGKRVQQRIFSSAWYPHIRISDNLLLHIPAILRRARHKVNCPKGKRGYSGV